MEENCGTCRFHRVFDKEGWVTCHRRAPVHPETLFRWPLVLRDEWCGEFDAPSQNKSHEKPLAAALDEKLVRPPMDANAPLSGEPTVIASWQSRAKDLMDLDAKLSAAPFPASCILT